MARSAARADSRAARASSSVGGIRRCAISGSSASAASPGANAPNAHCVQPKSMANTSAAARDTSAFAAMPVRNMPPLMQQA